MTQILTDPYSGLDVWTRHTATQYIYYIYTGYTGCNLKILDRSRIFCMFCYVLTLERTYNRIATACQLQNAIACATPVFDIDECRWSVFRVKGDGFNVSLAYANKWLMPQLSQNCFKVMKMCFTITILSQSFCLILEATLIQPYPFHTGGWVATLTSEALVSDLPIGLLIMSQLLLSILFKDDRH